jgi:threonine synthase
MKLSRQGRLKEGETVVCTLTGHGLKDADTAISVSVKPKTVQPTIEEVARLLNV